MHHETKMPDTVVGPIALPEPPTEGSTNSEAFIAEIKNLRTDFHSRLVVANLRTEAVRAGMVDLDGLKLINLSEARLDPDDKVVGGRQIMEELRRNKPWLFGTSSSSSVAAVPASQPVRHKTALEMTDEEYATARATLTKRRY
jgi:hypothetical protein